jgi:FkbH-like protein
MSRLSYADIQDALRRARLDGLPALRLSILRNVTIESMVPMLKYLAYQIGHAADVQVGTFDNVLQDALGGTPGLLAPDTDAVLVFTKLEQVSWALARDFTALSPDAIRAEIDRIRDLIASVIGGIRRQTDAMILWHGFESPLHPALGVMDAGDPMGQTAAVGELNTALRAALRTVPGTCYVDVDLCRARIGAEAFYDDRYWHIGRAPYSGAGLWEIASEGFKCIAALKGKARKCLVLDCDNVLWGGIVGEDGPQGIKIGTSYPGSAYREFQQQVLSLHHRGVLIALCSKNNEADVWEVFRTRPEMLLKEEHLAAFEINWDDKATNLRRLAERLRIGLDSLVFADDSEFEINWVRDALPQVETLHMPKDRAVTFGTILAACGLFDTLGLSAEDRARNEMYRAEARRRAVETDAPDLQKYLESLELSADVRRLAPETVQRVAQLTQKTNQFNATTRRYSEADVAAFMRDPAVDVFSIKVMDRFGDSGLVGVAIVKYDAGTALIDTFLLSCRVLGRGVEDVLMTTVMEAARARGCGELVGEYRPTAKNGQMADFYPRQGFAERPASEGLRYGFDLGGAIKAMPAHFVAIRGPFESPIGSDMVTPGRAE